MKPQEGPCMRTFIRGVLVLSMLALPVAAFAVDNGTNFSGAVDCSDSSTKSSCIECCNAQPGCGIGKISCCPLTGDCTVTNKPSGPPPPLNMKGTWGGLRFQFDRKISASGVASVKMKMTF